MALPRRAYARVIPAVRVRTFFCGTEQGDVLYTSSKLVKDGDSGKLVAPRPNWQTDAHAGPITTVARSPFFSDVLLTVGGWSFSIWKETENADVSSTPLLHVRFTSRLVHKCSANVSIQFK